MATIGLIHPESEALGGNRVTALRWARILRGLSWQVFHGPSWDGRPCDVLVALHARKSHDSIVRFARAHPDRPLIVAGAGTDLYTDVADAGEVRESLGLATRIVLLQPLAIERLEPEQRGKARVIYQSVRRPRTRPAPREDVFEVALLANVRPVKDPLCAVRAAELLPRSSRVRILHLGAVIDEGLVRELAAAARDVPSYVWLGARPRSEAMSLLARSRLSLSTSRHEGGANALSEALACDVPVLATRIPGALGILGEDYPGTFPVGDARALADLLVRAETDAAFLERLRAACRARRWLTDPATEVESWRRLLDELFPHRAAVEPSGAAPR